jgi:hypothetical protein
VCWNLNNKFNELFGQTLGDMISNREMRENIEYIESKYQALEDMKARCSETNVDKIEGSISGAKKAIIDGDRHWVSYHYYYIRKAIEQQTID